MSNQGNRSMSSQGGRGKDSSQQLVISLRRRGFDDKMLRSELKAQGFSKSNISRLIKRQHEREAGLSSQMSGKGRPSSFQAAASIAVLSVMKKPAASQLSDDNVDEDEILQPAHEFEPIGDMAVESSCQAASSKDMPSVMKKPAMSPMEILDDIVDVDAMVPPAHEPEPMDDAAAEVIKAHLKDQLDPIRGQLHLRATPGDGNCLFHAISVQVDAYAFNGHARLRHDICEHVDAHRPWYRPFFDGVNPDASLALWLGRMRRIRYWGDETVVAAAARFLNRPISVWHRVSEQPPIIYLPSQYDIENPVDPIYLDLDETHPGAEHYSSLLLEADMPQHCGNPLGGPCVFHGGCAAHLQFAAAARARGASSSDQPAPKRSRVEEHVPCADLRGADEAEWERDGDGQQILFHGVQLHVAWKLVEGLQNKESQRALAKKFQISRDLLHRWSMRLDDVIDDVKSYETLAARTEAGLCDAFPSIDDVKQILLALRAGNSNTRRLERLFNIGHMTISKWHRCLHMENTNDDDIDRLAQKCFDNLKQKAIPQHQATASAHTWLLEHQKHYNVAASNKYKPLKQLEAVAALDDAPILLWIKTASWAFCPACGRKQLGTYPSINVKKGCPGGCDHPAPEFKTKAEALLRAGARSKKLMAYTTPQETDVPDELRKLTPLQTRELAIVQVFVDFETKRGGRASITSKQKKSIVRAQWRKQPLDKDSFSSPDVAAAFDWLMRNNNTYRRYTVEHAHIYAQRDEDCYWYRIPTAELLLQRPGIEIAAFPEIYPWAAYGDTDLQIRLREHNLISEKSTPSLKTSWMRKFMSRCIEYQSHYVLQMLLFDIYLARRISSIVSIAEAKKIAPDEAANEMQNFSSFWVKETQKLEDMCRQQNKMPNLFFTVAPAEWSFPLHAGVFEKTKQDGLLSDVQPMLTLHFYNVFSTLVENLFADEEQLAKVGISKVNEFSMRFEFQSRGTLHIHVVAWVDYLVDPKLLQGKTGGTHDSTLVRHLEALFASSVDVQSGDSRHCLLRYVTGYVAKASDSLKFKSHESKGVGCAEHLTRWKQIFRLLCKRTLMWQEIALDFAGLPLMRASFTGETLYTPIPGSKAINSSRHMYEAFKTCATSEERRGSFAEWIRKYGVTTKKEANGSFQYTGKPRNLRGPHAGKLCAIGFAMPFELLDIFIGTWALTFLPDTREEQLILSEADSALVPEGFKFLAAVLRLPAFNNDTNKLKQCVLEDFNYRGLSKDRIRTFNCRVDAGHYLIQHVHSAEEASAWSAKRIFEAPVREWSPQQQEVLDTIAIGLNTTDADALRDTDRCLHVTGSPGTGKTEVVIQAAINAAADGCRVLIGAPIGVLVSQYRSRLPPCEEIVVETIHSAFRITRDRDAEYIPPGRLRHFDLIIFDEISQIDAEVWRKLQTGLSELRPYPFIVFVGDFQQLQPIDGKQPLYDSLTALRANGKLTFVELQQHDAARCKDPVLLDFLKECREKQPTRDNLQTFFAGRVLPSDPAKAARFAIDFERRRNCQFMFLTVKNSEAAVYNRARLHEQFPNFAEHLREHGVPGDEQSGEERIAFIAGMRIRLTHNVDKDRGFVNGMVGTIKTVLRKDVFVLETKQGGLILVHPIQHKGKLFMPCAYGYATTMRRAQGATLDAVGLVFDRRKAARGYAYVGASRCKTARTLFLVGRIRRTDWLPVRGDPEHEQPDMSALSLSSGSDEPNSSDMEDARPLHHRRPSFSEDDDSENELLERLAQRPPQYDIDEEAVLGWRAFVEDFNEIDEMDLRGLFD